MLIMFLMLSITWERGFDGVVIEVDRMAVFVFIGFDWLRLSWTFCKIPIDLNVDNLDLWEMISPLTLCMWSSA